MGFKGRSGEGVFTLAFVLPPMAWGRILCRERFCLKIHNSQLVPFFFWLVPNTTECVITKSTLLSIYSFVDIANTSQTNAKTKAKRFKVFHPLLGNFSRIIFYLEPQPSKLVSLSLQDQRWPSKGLTWLHPWSWPPPWICCLLSQLNHHQWETKNVSVTSPPEYKRNNNLRCFSLAVIHLWKAQ